ncbi:MAG: hypothetical protein H7Z37_06325 [Pyrinomonadaceae bacterium]|nr:hypothetical protein [Pyrinomonadaceae bacterium]
MENEDIEIIDSSGAEILSDFGYVDEPMNGTERYFLGVLGEKFVVRTKGFSGNTRGTLFFDRSNYARAIGEVENIYVGKLRETDKEELSFDNGKDSLILGIWSTFPHTSTRPIEQLVIKNIRRAELDGLNFGGWTLYMSIETGRTMLAEMKRIAPQVLNF